MYDDLCLAFIHVRGIQRYNTAVRCVLFLLVSYRMYAECSVACDPQTDYCMFSAGACRDIFSRGAPAPQQCIHSSIGTRFNVICGMYVRTRCIVMMWYSLYRSVLLPSVAFVRAHRRPVEMFSIHLRYGCKYKSNTYEYKVFAADAARF